MHIGNFGELTPDQRRQLWLMEPESRPGDIEVSIPRTGVRATSVKESTSISPLLLLGLAALILLVLARD